MTDRRRPPELTFEPVDDQAGRELLELRRYTTDEAVRLFGIPAAVITSPERLTRTERRRLCWEWSRGAS